MTRREWLAKLANGHVASLTGAVSPQFTPEEFAHLTAMLLRGVPVDTTNCYHCVAIVDAFERAVEGVAEQSA